MCLARKEMEELRVLLGEQVQLLVDTAYAMGELGEDLAGLRKAKAALIGRLQDIVVRHGLDVSRQAN